MTFEEYPTKAEAEQQAKEYATPLNKLIRPSDVDPSARKWTEVDRTQIEMEVNESVSVITSEHREIKHLIRECAFRLWCDDMRRLPREVLGDAPDRELVMVYQIQPHDMSNAELHSIAHTVFEQPNARIPDGYVQEAREAVSAGLAEGTKPDA